MGSSGLASLCIVAECCTQSLARFSFSFLCLTMTVMVSLSPLRQPGSALFCLLRARVRHATCLELIRPGVLRRTGNLEPRSDAVFLIVSWTLPDTQGSILIKILVAWM